MRRLLPYLVLIVALVFQNAAAVSTAAVVDASPMEHCEGHVSADEDCTCCPEGAMSAASCASQCSSAPQAPALITFISSDDKPSQATALTQQAIRNPAYVPLIPPPIV